ncbi:hypothetical protein ACH4S8_16725 [Streptomyces sp. NPDC021080]|uniref:hypothetical protein n=1 Tax=Streptomyces sp. NPDC021080 TaxID=3365110 RepID=UPI00378D68D7
MGIDEHVCPECGQPVATTVHRYKTLGAWVPKWGPGPCRNPDCAACAYEPGQGRRPGDDLPREAAAEKPRRAAPDTPRGDAKKTRTDV